jgi:NitT/TauT family transport system permease protein
MSKRAIAWATCCAVLLALWIALRLSLHSFVIPSPLAVLESFLHFGKHFRNICLSGALAFGGLLIAAASAAALVFLIGVAPGLKDFLFPFFIMVKSTPALALAPVLMCFVGIDVTCKLLVAASIAFFPLVVGGIDGLTQTPEGMLNLARGYGTKRLSFMITIGWGYSLSGFLTGLKTAAPLSVVGALVAEFVAGGKPTALGTFILTSNMNLQKIDVFAGAIMACALGLFFFGGASFLKDRVERRLHLVK